MILFRTFSIRLSAKSLSKRVSNVNILHSLSSISSESEKTPNKLVYVGEVGKRLQRLKRVSMASSVITTVIMPLGFFLSGLKMLLIGKALISTMVISGSVSSTILLYYVTKPYVYHLEISSVTLSEEPIQPPDTLNIKSDMTNTEVVSEGPTEIIHFRASQLDVFGNEYYTEFTSSEVVKGQNLIHPFASFTARGKVYFIDIDKLQSKKLKSIF